MSKSEGSKYAEKQRLKHGSGAIDPRWMSWFVSVDKTLGVIPRPFAREPLSYGRGRKRRRR